MAANFITIILWYVSMLYNFALKLFYYVVANKNYSVRLYRQYFFVNSYLVNKLEPPKKVNLSVPSFLKESELTVQTNEKSGESMA